ncbi:folate/biopterin family MFS transporter [Alkalinema sp. FACHB-956]|nr:folate/biopterin family MFS transporter [Alkalinema sp. FACHB-956]MBD2329918.1 folate/biopterin family MFS transporter [Alkalinema sp. FACHB-956]
MNFSDSGFAKFKATMQDTMQGTVQKVQSTVQTKLFFGHEPSPELLAILLVYFVQGILGLARLAVSFFLKDELALGPAEVSSLLGIVSIPWMVKPLFGFISDGLPILGYRRRPYLILSGILGVASWVSLATLVHSGWSATLAIALGSLSIAMSDVIVDSLVVERARAESQSAAGSLQSLCWGASAVGGLLTAYFSGSLLQQFSTQTVFLITATFPLIVSAVAWLIAETPLDEKPNWAVITQQFGQLKQAISQRSIFLPTLFLFLWQATPTGESAFFYFTTNELGFEPEFLGRVRLVTSFASIAGIWIFQRFLKKISFRVIFGWSTVIASVLGLSALILVTHLNRELGISDRWFSLGDSLILTVMGQIAFMPVLVLAARLCPPGVEATLFALLMSVVNLAGFVSYQGGAFMMRWLNVTDHNFEQLGLLILITNLMSLLPLPLLGWLPSAAELPTGDEEVPVAIELDSSASKHLGQPFLPDVMAERVVDRVTVKPASTATNPQQ